MDTMMVVTCKECRGWYSMDMEESLDSEHWDMRTGKLCSNNDDNHWYIAVAPYREDWRFAN